MAQRDIIWGYDEENAIQMQGIDVRVRDIRRVDSWYRNGMVHAGNRKTDLPATVEVDTIRIDEQEYWTLDPGYYEVTLVEGITVPRNVSLHLKTRSSLVRCGAIVHSGQFDAGFHTEHGGCFLQVINPVLIAREARIAQAICFSSQPVDELYDGQWQGDRQRDF